MEQKVEEAVEAVEEVPSILLNTLYLLKKETECILQELQ
jgi:hypothetical protein